MKKLLIMSLLLFVAVSCNTTPLEKIERQEEAYDWLSVRKFDYEGHSYIMFANKNSYMGCISGVVHDPDCQCK